MVLARRYLNTNGVQYLEYKLKISFVSSTYLPVNVSIS
jgi:hypothetical protein